MRPRPSSRGLHRSPRARTRAGTLSIRKSSGLARPATSPHESGCRNGGQWPRADGIDARERAPPPVLVVVHKYTSFLAPRDTVLGCHQRWIPRRQLHGERLGERPDGLLYRPAHDRDVEMHASGSTSLDERLHAERLEGIPDDQRALAHLLERRALTRVKVEVYEVRPIDVVAFRVPLVQIDAPEIDDPKQRRQVVNNRKVERVARPVLDNARADPVRPRRRRPLHEEEWTCHTVGIALHHHCAVADVWKQHGRYIRVVLEQRAFCDSTFRPERLPQARQAHLTARNHQRRAIDAGRNQNPGCAGHFRNRLPTSTSEEDPSGQDGQSAFDSRKTSRQ